MIQIVGEVALPVFMFYLLVACNYIKEIFGCQLQTLLNTSMIAKHGIGIVLLFFLIVIINPENADKDMIRNVLLTLGIYGWFVMTTRTPVYITFIVLLLLLASYIFQISMKRYEKEQKEEERRKAQLYHQFLALFALGISVIGFVFYTIEKKREYKNDFMWSRFFSGNLNCRGYTPNSAKIIRS